METERSKRVIKGIFIPLQIWEHENLTWPEKVILAEINSLQIEDTYGYLCHRSKNLGLSKQKLNKIISSLIKKGFITNDLVVK